MRIMGLVLLSTLAAATLAGCASIPLKTVYNLWNFDPWTSDFKVWRAAVRVPEVRGFSLDQARIQMRVETQRNGDAQPFVETFVLERSREPSDLAPLSAEGRPGYALAAYRFASSDYARMESLRARIVTAKNNGTHKRGSLSISAASCGGPAEPPAGAVLLSTYLMVNAKDGYNPLLIDYDLGPEMRKSSGKGEPPPICAVAK